jgi:peptidoglycan/LPS O-acetylase OafA/YrhL
MIAVSAISAIRRERQLAHFRSLDGLRAMSIILVLLGHLSGTKNFGELGLSPYLGDVAHLGVVVFFVISGFLITSLLVKEHATHGRISLKLFYARRALRIFPASYAYVLVVLLLFLARLISIRSGDIVHSFTYTVNYAPAVSWHVGHLWSLSVEEQFYLVWPFAFANMRARNRTWFIIAILCIAPAARLVERYLLEDIPHGFGMFPMVMDSLASGCLLATARSWLERQRWYIALFHPVSSLALLGTVFALNRILGYNVTYSAGLCVINLSICVLIHRCVLHSDDGVGRFLNWTPVAFCGALSYSLYLWQQMFLNRDSDSWVTAFPQNLLLVIATALTSYLLLERPLMRLRSRLRV